MFRMVLQNGEVLRLYNLYRPTQPRMHTIALYLRQQTAERFQGQGASSGRSWAVPKEIAKWGYDDGRSLLTGVSSHLKESFKSYGTDNTAVLYSDASYSYVQQKGTRGKGGELADIVPRKAKALFIPITDRAITSQRTSGRPAMYIRRATGEVSSMHPLRVATRGPRMGGSVFMPLVRGRLHQNRLQKWDGFEYVDGIPDFIFLQKISIPPRPMLPDSGGEREDQKTFAAGALRDGAMR